MTDPGEKDAPYNHHASKQGELLGRRAIENSYPRLDEINEKLSGGYIHHESRSSLAIDDAYLGAYRGGALQRGPINAAWDALNTIRLVLTTNAMPMAGMYPLLRAAIENSALALWTLYPLSRDERLGRSYRLMAGEAHDQSNFTKTIGVDGSKTDEKITRNLRELIAARPGVGAEKTILARQSRNITDIVRHSDRVMHAVPNTSDMYTALSFWQLFSGLTHGKQWAFVTALERSDAIVDEHKKMAWVTQTSSTLLVGAGFLKAVTVLEFTLQVFGQRARAWTAQPEDVSDPHFNDK